jgi:hypothetical protein
MVITTTVVMTTVYESDRTGDVRQQGGSLDIHEESGQRALREAGLHGEFLRLTHPQGEHIRVLDKHGTVFIDSPGRGGRPEIDRTALRTLLAGALDPDRIAWATS